MLEYSIQLVHTPLCPFLTILNTREVDKHNEYCGFLEKLPLAEHVLLEISGIVLIPSLPKNLEIKDGGERLLKGGVFSGTYSVCIYTYMCVSYMFIPGRA